MERLTAGETPILAGATWPLVGGGSSARLSGSRWARGERIVAKGGSNKRHKQRIGGGKAGSLLDESGGEEGIRNPDRNTSYTIIAQSVFIQAHWWGRGGEQHEAGRSKS